MPANTITEVEALRSDTRRKCSLWHVTEDGDGTEVTATAIVTLATAIGEGTVYVCDAHMSTPAAELALWLEPIAGPIGELVGEITEAGWRALVDA